MPSLTKYVFLIVILSCLISLCLTHECYVCENQESNKDKCIKTTRQCTQYQDSCRTKVMWTVPPEWTRGGFTGDRRHYIYKECMNYTECLRQRTTNTLNCTREWYEDWECIDCCRGDMCNFYVTLGASGLTPSTLALWGVAAATVVVWFGGEGAWEVAGGGEWKKRRR